MNSNEIRGELLKRGYTLKKVAQEVGCSPSAVTQTLASEINSRRVIVFISKLFKKEPGDVFPEATHLFSNSEKIPQKKAS